MTTNVADWQAPALPDPSGSATPPPPPTPKKKIRKFSWAIIIFNVLMLVWMIAGSASAAHGQNCDTTYLSQDACNSATAVGAGIAIFALLFVTALVDMILGVIWMVTRKNHQH